MLSSKRVIIRGFILRAPERRLIVWRALKELFCPEQCSSFVRWSGNPKISIFSSVVSQLTTSRKTWRFLSFLFFGTVGEWWIHKTVRGSGSVEPRGCSAQSPARFFWSRGKCSRQRFRQFTSKPQGFLFFSGAHLSVFYSKPLSVKAWVWERGLKIINRPVSIWFWNVAVPLSIIDWIKLSRRYRSVQCSLVVLLRMRIVRVYWDSCKSWTVRAGSILDPPTTRNWIKRGFEGRLPLLRAFLLRGIKRMDIWGGRGRKKKKETLENFSRASHITNLAPGKVYPRHELTFSTVCVLNFAKCVHKRRQ